MSDELRNRRRSDMHPSDRALRPFNWVDAEPLPGARTDREQQTAAEKSLTGETE